MKEEEKLTYESIAIRLTKECIKSARTHLPIVNDGITWRDKDDVLGQGRAAVRYDVYEGTHTTSLVVQKKGEPGFVLMKDMNLPPVEKQSLTKQQSFS